MLPAHHLGPLTTTTTTTTTAGATSTTVLGVDKPPQILTSVVVQLLLLRIYLPKSTNEEHQHVARSPGYVLVLLVEFGKYGVAIIGKLLTQMTGTDGTSKPQICPLRKVKALVRKFPVLRHFKLHGEFIVVNFVK